MPIFDDLGTAAPKKRKPTRSSAPAPAPAPKRAPAPYERTEVSKLTPFEVEVQRDEPALPSYVDPKKADEILGINYADPSTWTWLRDEVADFPNREATEPPPETKMKTRKTYEMTWDDYQALSDPQRAAVDFNTLLIQAREKDLNTDYKPTEAKREEYDRTVTEMFGDEGGSDTFAPETLSVLTQLDFEAYDGEDFDDFISLKKTISERELTKFAPELVREVDPIAAFTSPGTAVEERYVGEDQLAMNTAAMAESMARSHALVRNFVGSLRTNRSELVDALGGEPKEKFALDPGWDPTIENKKGETTIDEFFRSMFLRMAQKDVDAAEVWKQAVEGPAQLTPQEQKQYLDYADLRSRQLEMYDLDFAQVKGVEFRTPQEFRRIMHLDGEADRG